MLRPSLSQEELWGEGKGFNCQLFIHPHKSLFCPCVLGKGAHCPSVAQLASCWTSMTSSNISRTVGVKGTGSLNESHQRNFFAHVLRPHSLQTQPLGTMFSGLETGTELKSWAGFWRSTPYWQAPQHLFLLTYVENLIFLFDTWSHYKALTDFKSTILIPQPHKC